MISSVLEWLAKVFLLLESHFAALQPQTSVYFNGMLCTDQPELVRNKLLNYFILALLELI